MKSKKNGWSDDTLKGKNDWQAYMGRIQLVLIGFILLTSYIYQCKAEAEFADLSSLREKTKEMFLHGYHSYMRYAYPFDELMPLNCNGRQRGVTPSRGDVDYTLGNFSLTLIDTLDTLVVVGEYEEFEKAVLLVIQDVSFDTDIVVSVFETNIRVIGGLISAHFMCLLLKHKENGFFEWYSNELLIMATDVADRLLPAFNTTSGVPHTLVNLKSGLLPELRLMEETCTACGGTMILEWASLSRLTGNPIYEESARKAMNFLWEQRHHESDLVGAIMNINSGNWVRRDTGIGAGIDSYYEYTLKAYILLGEEGFLHRFNKHYDAVMKFLNKGPVYIDVYMNKPTIATRFYMDALMAFWPTLQVLKGDIRPAIEVHEMLYNVIKRHKFLPEAFTHDLQVYWAHHSLRPEFLESTYFLYRATKDPYYVQVARQVMLSLEELRVPCGFASVKDVRTMEHDDVMESFVLSETFKYLYLIFAQPSDLLFDPDDFVFTTEAHLLPLNIVHIENVDKLPRKMLIDPDELVFQKSNPQYVSACPNPMQLLNSTELTTYGADIRQNTNQLLETIKTAQKSKEQSCPISNNGNQLQSFAFSPSSSSDLEQLKRMGVKFDGTGRIVDSHDDFLLSAHKSLPTCKGDNCDHSKQKVLLSSATNMQLLQTIGTVLIVFSLWAFVLIFTFSTLFLIHLSHVFVKWLQRIFRFATGSVELSRNE